MPEFGFPPQSATSRINAAVSDLRKRAERAQIETVTGRHQDPAAALDGRTGELYLVQKSLGDIQDYGRSIGLAEGRTAVMQTAIAGARTQTESLINDATNALEFGSASMRDTVGNASRTVLASIVSALNSRFGDRALFAGDAGGAAAITDAGTILAQSDAVLGAAPDAATAYANLTAAYDTPGGMFETQIYTGGAGSAPPAEVAPGDRIDYGIRADVPAFRNLLRNVAALTLALDPGSSIPPDQRDEIASLALGGLRNNIPEVVTVASTLGISEARIAEAKSRNQAAETTLTISFNELAGRDQFEAAAELKSLEVQLETAYVTTARISNLNLSNFLR